MSEQANVQGEFIVKILDTLSKNGFPEKKVSLPLEKLYEAAHAKGINFNRILEFLAEKDGIHHQKEGDRIIFSTGPVEAPAAASPFPGFDMNAMKGMDFGSMMSQAQDMMKNASPDQLAKIKELMNNMSPEQMSQIQNMFSNMTPDQMKDLKEKAEQFMNKD